MPRKPESEPSPFARSVAEGLLRLIETEDVSQAAVARKAQMSANYLNERLLMRKSFTLSDIEALSKALHFNPVQFLIQVDKAPAVVTPIRPNVGGFLDDALQERDTAAGEDETQAEDD